MLKMRQSMSAGGCKASQKALLDIKLQNSFQFALLIASLILGASSPAPSKGGEILTKIKKPHERKSKRVKTKFDEVKRIGLNALHQ